MCAIMSIHLSLIVTELSKRQWSEAARRVHDLHIQVARETVNKSAFVAVEDNTNRNFKSF